MLNLDPGFMNIPGYHVIKNDKGEYLQIIKAGTYGRPQDGLGLCAEVRWTKRKALRAQWRSADAVNHQVVIMKLNDDGKAVFSGGWCVGLEAAAYLMNKHGGHLVFVKLRHHEHHRKAA
jgi:hypothetical protein